MRDIEDRKRVVFTAMTRRLASIFWTPACERLADELGFSVVVPMAASEAGVAGEAGIADWTPYTADADAVITGWGSPRCSAKWLAGAPGVRIVGHCGGSVAGVVDETTYAAGVAVTTANPVMAEAVAEWSLMATLLAQRNLPAYARMGPYGQLRWQSREDMADLRSMTVGIWGYGDVTRRLLEILAPLRPGRILVASDYAAAGEMEAAGAVGVDLETLLAESDILHCLKGANAANHHRIDTRELAMLKDGATIVNGGRAWLIREEPLLAELRSGRLRGVFDVYYEEPLPESSPWRSLDNVILTPHNAGYSGYSRYVPFLLEEFARFFRGEALRARVDPARWRSMTVER